MPACLPACLPGWLACLNACLFACRVAVEKTIQHVEEDLSNMLYPKLLRNFASGLPLSPLHLFPKSPLSGLRPHMGGCSKTTRCRNTRSETRRLLKPQKKCFKHIPFWCPLYVVKRAPSAFLGTRPSATRRKSVRGSLAPSSGREVPSAGSSGRLLRSLAALASGDRSQSDTARRDAAAWFSCV